MPVYQYKCKSCGFIEDIEQSITETPIKTCSKCSGEVFRVIGRNVGVQFKGQGFYVNDSKGGSDS